MFQKTDQMGFELTNKKMQFIHDQRGLHQRKRCISRAKTCVHLKMVHNTYLPKGYFNGNMMIIETTQRTHCHPHCCIGFYTVLSFLGGCLLPLEGPPWTHQRQPRSHLQLFLSSCHLLIQHLHGSRLWLWGKGVGTFKLMIFHTRWGPPDHVCWFITPSNYRYIMTISWYIISTQYCKP